MHKQAPVYLFHRNAVSKIRQKKGFTELRQHFAMMWLTIYLLVVLLNDKNNF